MCETLAVYLVVIFRFFQIFICKQRLHKLRMKLRIWSHLLKKFLMESFIVCAVNQEQDWQCLVAVLKRCYKQQLI